MRLASGGALRVAFAADARRPGQSDRRGIIVDARTHALTAVVYSNTLGFGAIGSDGPYVPPVPNGDFNSFAVIDFLKPNGSYAPIITATAQEVADLTLDRSNGNAIVWVEGDGAAPVTNTVLWTSPYATSVSTIQRRRVTAFADTTGAAGGPLVANAGAVVLITSATTAAVVRLADGASWTVQAESGDRFFAGSGSTTTRYGFRRATRRSSIPTRTG